VSKKTDANASGAVLLRLADAARELDVSETTVRRYTDSGQLAHLRDTSGQRLFTRVDIEAAKAQRRAKP
jgi:DNA-binding transcriptional MerR regulator